MGVENIYRYKIIKFFGAEFKIKQKYATQKDLNNLISRVEHLETNGIILRNNFIFLLSQIFNDADNQTLYTYNKKNIKNEVIYIFTKKFFNLDYDFICNFLNQDNNPSIIYELTILDENSVLYKENIDYFNNKTYCIKYSYRDKYYVKQSIYDKNGEIYIKKIIPEGIKHPETESFKYNETDRKYIKGISAFDYMLSMSLEEKKQFLTKFYEYIFNNYLNKEGFVSGELWDCHLRNFIYYKEKFYPIDTEIVYKKNFEKNTFIFRSLMTVNSDLRVFVKYFLNLYGYKTDEKYLNELSQKAFNEI